MSPISFVGLVALGGALGAFGTFVGAGGGFLLMPLLLMLYPSDSPQTLTSISLAIVFFNAASGTWGYRRLRRIDYRAGRTFAAATVPAGFAGVAVNYLLPRQVFDVAFGMVVSVVAVYLFLAPRAGDGA